MIRMSSRTTQLCYTSFIEYIVYLRFETSQSWSSLLQYVQQRTNHTKWSIRHSKNWRKELPIRVLLHFSECQKIPCWHGKRPKTKSLKCITVAFISKRVNPEKLEELKKAMHKWFLILRKENVSISGATFNEKNTQNHAKLAIYAKNCKNRVTFYYSNTL